MKEATKKVRLSKPIDVDKIDIRRDDYFSSAYIIDLLLDSTPDHAWQDIFERAWKTGRHLWDRKLFVIGDKLRLVTTANEIEEKLSWVKQVIERTNKDVDEYNREAEVRKTLLEEPVRRQVLDEEARIGRIRETLKKSLAL